MKIILTIPDDQLHFVLFGINQATEGMNKSIQVLPNSDLPVAIEGPEGSVGPCDEGLLPTITIHRKLAKHQQSSLHQKVNL